MALPTDEDDRAVATAVISLGQKLNLRVIAEGVETDDQIAFLRENNCDEMQGYHFSKPVRAARNRGDSQGADSARLGRVGISAPARERRRMSPALPTPPIGNRFV